MAGKCESIKLTTITKNLAKLAASGLGRALCQQLKSALTLAKGMLQAELTALLPIVQLETTFVETFYVTPLGTVESVLNGANNKIVAPLYILGIDKECSSHKKLHDNVEKAQKPLKSAANWAGNLKNYGQAHIDAMNKRIEDIRLAIDSIDHLLDGIQCP